MEYYSAIKKKKQKQDNTLRVTIDATRDYHTKWSQIEKDKYYMISLICGDEPIYKTETDLWTTENRLVVAKGKGGGGGMVWEAEISTCKLLYIGWMDNRVLLYSTENYI